VQGFWALSVVFLSLLTEAIALYYNFFNSLYAFQQTLRKNSIKKQRHKGTAIFLIAQIKKSLF